MEKTISTLEAGDVLSGVCLLKEKALLTSRAGTSYMNLLLADSTGEIEGKLWDNAEATEPHIERGTPVLVEGQVTVFRDKLQLTIRKIVQLEWSDELKARLLPVSDISLDELTGRMKKLVQQIRDPQLQRLAQHLLADDEVSAAFFAAPAAKRMHHATIRGLAEHSLSMMELVSLIADHYESHYPGQINRDLLVMGAMLHDLGKTAEYHYESSIDFTTRGRLTGHIVLGIRMLDRALDQLKGFPEELGDLLRHLIASHHGSNEMGSPVEPVTIEAIILHHVDYMDAQVKAAQELLKNTPSGSWTGYGKSLGRMLYNPASPPPAASEATLLRPTGYVGQGPPPAATPHRERSEPPPRGEAEPAATPHREGSEPPPEPAIEPAFDEEIDPPKKKGQPRLL